MIPLLIILTVWLVCGLITAGVFLFKEEKLTIEELTIGLLLGPVALLCTVFGLLGDWWPMIKDIEIINIKRPEKNEDDVHA